MRKRVLAGTLVMVLFAAGVWAQQGPDSGGRGMPGGGRLYDPSKAETISGEVVQVNEFEARGGMHKIVGLSFKAGGKTMSVHLGPQFYLDKQTVKIAAGDHVEITGVRTMLGDREIFVAGQVKKGGQVLKLHDETGRPLWAGQGPGPGPGGGQQQRKPPIGC